MTEKATFHLDPDKTALVLVDLQRGIANRTTAPHPAASVVQRAAMLAAHFRERKAAVVLVRVRYSADNRDRLRLPVDAPPPASILSPDFSEFMPELRHQDSDIVIDKKQWGAFYGTDLDLQLRRRGIDTLVLGGIATNMGVESTARDAFERGYALVFAEDAMSTSLQAEGAHAFAIGNIFPRIGRVRSAEEVRKALVAVAS